MQDINEYTPLPGSVMTPPLFIRLIVEFLGTLTFVFFGAGTAAHLGATDGGAPSPSAALAHGIVTAVLIYLFADVSGAHFNPGPTIVEMYTRKMNIVTGLLYMLFQAGGALSAGGLLLIIYGTHHPLGTPTFNDHNLLLPPIHTVQAFFIEFIGGIFLMVTAYTSARKGHSPATSGLAVGGALTVIFLFAATLDGAAMNPWRWLGPAVASRTFNDGFWIYLVAPPAGFVVGHLIAAGLHSYIPSQQL